MSDIIYQQANLQSNLSEITRVRQEIETVCAAMACSFTGYAETTRHLIIAQRFKQLDLCREKLGSLIGEDQATEIVTEVYNKSMDTI